MSARVVYNYRLYCNTESNYVNSWGQSIPTLCPHNSTHSINSNNITIVDTISSSISQITGLWTDNSYNQATVTNDNKLSVDIPLSAFGLAKVQEDYPQIQLDFRHGLSSRFTQSTVTGTGTITAYSSSNLAFISTGASTNSSANLSSLRCLKYSGGQGGNIMFTGIFSSGVAGNTQVYGCGTSMYGFFFGYNGTQFGVLWRQNGVDNWISQSNWNVDKMDGTGPSAQVINPQKGNVYRITFQWLGFGMVTFMMEHTLSGTFVPVHRIQYANTYLLPTVNDPSFPMYIQSTNTTNATNVAIQSTCFAAMLEGTPVFLGLTFGIDNTKTMTTTTLTNIITLKCKTTLNAETLMHHIPVLMKMLSISTNGNKPATVYLIASATLGGTPSYTDISTVDSVISYDTNGTTVTGGTQIAAFAFASADSRTISLNDLNFILYPGTLLTCAAKLPATGSTDVTCCLTWQEDR